MARQESIFARGKISNLIFYYYRGKPCVRAMPDKVKQSSATKQSAQKFGQAARLSKLIRKALKPLYTDLKDASIMPRLNGALMEYLSQGKALTNRQEELTALQYFNFNTERTKGDVRILPIVSLLPSGKIRISLPEGEMGKVFQMPSIVQSVSLKLGLVVIDVEKMVEAGSWIKNLHFKGPLPGETIDLPLTTGKGQLIVLAYSTRFHTEKHELLPLLKKEYMPTNVLWTCWTGK